MTSSIWNVIAGLPPSLMEIGEFSPFVHGLDHPECVACGPDGEIYAGGEAGQVYRVSPADSFSEIGTTGGFLLGISLDMNGNVYGCDSARREIIRMTPNGQVSSYSSGSPERRMITPNYGVFDAAGNLYVSDSGDWNEDNGCVFRIRSGGETEIFSDKLTSFPNGMALHPDGTHLYVVLSQTPGVSRIAIERGGSPGTIETVVTLPHNVPDGLAFDEAGNLYVACYTPDVIYRISPRGEAAVLAADWESVTFATPTNIAFCGSDRRTLVVASLSRWHLTRGQMPIAGAKLNYPRIEHQGSAG